MAKTVLIIDDDPVICQVIENILYQFSYKVSTAASTFGGLVYLQQQQHIDICVYGIVIMNAHTSTVPHKKRGSTSNTMIIYFTDGFGRITLVDRLAKHSYYCEIPVG